MNEQYRKSTISYIGKRKIFYDRKEKIWKWFDTEEPCHKYDND